MRALKPETYDLLFRLVSQHLPAPPVHPIGGGRPRISDEICFRGLFHRFITGAAWETIEVFLDFQVSDTTLRTRRNEWVQAGVFKKLMHHAVAEYDRLIGIDTTNVIIDGSTQLAPGGGPDTNNYHGSKGRLGFKWSVAVDGKGTPIGYVIDTGSRNDYKLLEPTLDQVFTNPTIDSIGCLHLDRGYGYPSVTEKLKNYQINTTDIVMRNKPYQGRIQLVGFNQRWIVERTNGWLTNFRQLKLNWDRTIEHRQAAFALAVTVLTLYRLIDHLKDNHLPPEAIR